ncbi:MAG: YihY/virulence factor BrkB family protein [Nitrospira sp.]
MWALLKSLATKTIAKWSDEPGPRFAAALAFYTALTIVPLVVLTIMVSVSMVGDESMAGGLQRQIGELIGESAANGLFQIIAQWRSSGSPLVNGIVALGVFVIGALKVMDQLRDALDCIWGLQSKHPPGMGDRLKRRFASLSGLFGIAFILLASLTLSAWIGVAVQYVLEATGMPGKVVQGIGLLMSFGMVSTLFAMIYKWVPQAEVAWLDVWVGAGITGLLYLLGSKLLVVYLAHNTVAFYGAAGSLVLVLLWAYYASQVFLFGAAFIAVYATHHGSQVKPTKEAVVVHAASQGESHTEA